MRMRTGLMVAVLVGAGCAVFSGQQCEYSAPRSALVAAEGATTVQIDAGAGFLVVSGQSGLGEVRATGKACASRESLLEDVELVTRRDGDRIVIETRFPKRLGRGNNCSLELTVEVPAELMVEINDGSGEIEVTNVASLLIDDGSGEIKVATISGDVKISDGSGEIDVHGVTGSVTVQDGSGEITVQRVDGDVVVTDDGSGDISVIDVGGSLLVEDDGSGGIRAEQIGGDFTVLDDGSGGIDHKDVAGTVKIPRD